MPFEQAFLGQISIEQKSIDQMPLKQTLLSQKSFDQPSLGQMSFEQTLLVQKSRHHRQKNVFFQRNALMENMREAAHSIYEHYLSEKSNPRLKIDELVLIL